MAVSPVILEHVYACLAGLKDGEVRSKASELAAHYGVTLATVYRWAAMKGLRWRKQRATKGSSRVADDALLKASALLFSTKRASKDIPLPACDAREILDDSGIDTGGVSDSWFRARLRQRQVSAKDLLRPAPHQNLISKHPNHVWQFDVTNCIQYFLDDRKGMGERDMDMELYKNKIVKTAKQIKRELLRYAAVDHCTGAFYFRYFYASGEKASDGARFLFEAMRPKDEIIKRTWNGGSEAKLGTYHFHGVPLMLVADRGSIMVAKRNQTLLDALRVQVETHLPGNPRAKGAIEGLMHIINRFESRLRFRRPSSLDELNAWALDWTIMMCGTKKMRNVAPRSALWSMITKEQLRLCPEEDLYRTLIREPLFERTANGARIISVDGERYLIPDPHAAGQKVTVSRNAYEYPKIDVHFNGHVWLLSPIEKDVYGRLTVGAEYGEYKGIKHTETQKAKKEIEKISAEWGLTWKGTGDKRRAEAPPLGQETPLQVFGHQADKVKVEFLNRKGTELDIKQPGQPRTRPVAVDAHGVSRSIVARRISMTEFLKRVVQAVGPVGRELNQRLRAQYGDSIEISEAEEVIQQLLQGQGGHDERSAGIM